MNDATSLGTLAILPTEIRIMIWEYVYSRKFNEPTTNRLAIRGLNHRLYSEVSSTLYRNMEFSVTLLPWDCDPGAIIRSEKLNTSWSTTGYNGSIIRAFNGFRRFPWHRVRLMLNITAPSHLGELILLWNRVKDFVSILKSAKYIKHLEIELLDWGKRKWHKSVQYSDERLSDFDIIFLTFCRLNRVKSIVVKFESLDKSVDTRFLRQICRFLRRKPLRDDDQRRREIAEQLEDIEALIADTTVHLNTLLASRERR